MLKINEKRFGTVYVLIFLFIACIMDFIGLHYISNYEKISNYLIIPLFLFPLIIIYLVPCLRNYVLEKDADNKNVKVKRWKLKFNKKHFFNLYLFTVFLELCIVVYKIIVTYDGTCYGILTSTIDPYPCSKLQYLVQKLNPIFLIPWILWILVTAIPCTFIIMICFPFLIFYVFEDDYVYEDDKKLVNKKEISKDKEDNS